MMQVNQELEKKLWSVSSDDTLDSTHLTVLQYLVERLSDFLQVGLLVNTFNDEINEESFCWTFRADTSNSFFEPFNITFNGILGMGLNYDEDIPHYSASIFMFGNGKRLTNDNGSTYIELFYEKQSDQTGLWRSLGWQEDEFWEFEDVEEDTYGHSALTESKPVS